jgi:hypothetical protein
MPALAEKLHLNFYELYVRMEEKRTGGDSKVTKFAKMSFDKLLEKKKVGEVKISGSMSVWQRGTKVLGKSLWQMSMSSWSGLDSRSWERERSFECNFGQCCTIQLLR